MLPVPVSSTPVLVIPVPQLHAFKIEIMHSFSQECYKSYSNLNALSYLGENCYKKVKICIFVV